ncbi:PhzF family phenazine biosynthesis protein [Halocalculus aciditolerans]|uniref:PhzF family phenazine biosynthesis protein n=1 Tax=Halocalculus aciditolerans TaxID=1383812 RepID=A0A830F7I9_9EURY|nr:PhzF family phenazine biosynthesis protein [Halocalculus aciditolerans]GGL70870.1 hypothetical protein GCM10009039_31190 [Halocalculus aciditolerans]
MNEEFETLDVAVVDAFTDEPLAGNPAGVVLDGDGLAADQMQRIAREVNASETAFVRESDDADRRLRYFTPTDEVDLCGHATIATHARLFEEGVIDAGTHSIETNVGVLDIDVEDDGTVWMTQERPDVRGVDVEYERVADAIDVDVAALEDVGADLPVARATTGLPFLVVPVNFLEHLGAAAPDFDAVEALADEFDCAGVYALTFDAVGVDSTLHGRCWVPGLGIDEDPVTGTASGAVGGYLERFDAFDDFPDELRFEQGHYVDRPGTVRVRVDDRAHVAGTAVTSIDGDLIIPEPEADDILEA